MDMDKAKGTHIDLQYFSEPPAEPPNEPPAEPPVEEPPAIDIDSFNQKADNPKGKVEPTAEERVAELEKQLKISESEKAKFKAAFDRKAKETGDLTKEKRALEQATAEKSDRELQLEQQLTEIKANQTKESLKYSLSENLKVSSAMTSEIVSSVFSDDTGGLDVGAFEVSMSKLVESVDKQSYERGLRDGANGTKPKGVGKLPETDEFEKAFGEAFN